MSVRVVDLAEERFRRRALQLYRRGPRLVVELLEQIGRDRSLGTYLDDVVEEFLDLPDDALDITGGRDMPEGGA